jgi:tripartite-type tricarboxylate transporter receptor subunit TctC
MKAAVRKAATPRRTAFRNTERRLVTQHPRRRILSLAAGAAALPAVSRISWAQAYPTRPVRIIVPNAAGGATSLYARLIGQVLWDRLGQQFIIENRPGGGGNIATEAVIRSAPDGYTLLMATLANAVNATLYDKLNFIFIRDVAPVARLARTPLVVVVHPSVPVRTVPEFIAYAKANPGKLNMASAGIGGASHLSGELFKMMTGVNMVHVPYRGGAPAIADLLGGQMQVMFNVLPESIEYIRAGKLRALAVTSINRSDALPDLPIAADFVPGFEVSYWVGVGAPKNTPPEIIGKLNKEINAALADPVLKARFANLVSTVFPTSPAEFGKFIADETEKWGKVIRAANIKAE